MRVIFSATIVSLFLSISAAFAVNKLTPAQQEEVKLKSGKWMEQTQQAERFIKSHKFEPAEKIYKSILAEREALGLDLSAQHNALAWLYADWKKNDLAEEQFNEQLASVEKNAGLDEMMFNYPLGEHAKFLERLGKRAEAKKLRQRIQTITAKANAPVKLPSIPKGLTPEQKIEEAKKLTDKGRELIESELHKKALVYLNRSIELNPNDPTAYLLRSRAETWQDNFPKALEDLTTAIRLKADYAEAYADRGHVHSGLKQYPKALADYAKAFELNPKDVDSMGSKAKLEDTLGKHKEAVADYTKVIEVDPSLSWPYVQRGIAYESLNQFQKAIADYTILCDRYPKSYDFYEIRGQAYLKANQLDKSLKDYNKVLALNPHYRGGYANRAKVYRKMDGKQSPRVMADIKKSK